MKQLEIVVLDGEIANPGDISWQGVESLGSLKVYPSTKPGDVVKNIGNAGAVILNKVPITREIIQACPGLAYIGLLSTGYNIIDLQAAKERGIPVCNVPEYSTAAVAQSAIALLLEICNQVGHHSAEVHAGKWGATQNWSFWSKSLIELQGKTMGIVGFGNIGRVTGRVAAALGMRVLAAGSRPTEAGRAIAEYVPLPQLLAEADVVSLHCPLTSATQHLIAEQTIAQMKQGAILLNTARGGLVDEEALAAALNSGRVYAAGVDVVSEEPIADTNPLLKAKNCFITPHIAWAAAETRTRLLEVVAGNLRAWAEGSPVNVVNP